MSDDLEKPCGYPVLECELSEMFKARIEELKADILTAVKMLSDADFDYNRRTNDLIQRHAVQLAKATEIVDASGRKRGELEAKLAQAVEALELADAAMSGANMNMRAVERKVKTTIAAIKGEE